MVEYRATELSLAFAALADPSRRLILDHLRGGEQRVTDLAEPFPSSLNAISKHVKVPERAGLVRRRRRGREHFIALVPDPLRAVEAWIARYRAFWEPRLDALDALLREEHTAPEGDPC